MFIRLRNLRFGNCHASLTVTFIVSHQKFPVEEKFGLVSQIRRASISIASNIAEGSARNTAKDQANFYGMAFSSAIEVLNQLIICNDLQYLSIGDYENGRKKIEEITNKLNGLRKTAIERQLSSKRINS